MTIQPRVVEVRHQEQNKSALTRWMEWLFLSRPSPRKYARYEQKRFNPITGRIE